jgi:hypothetical protein
MDPPEPRCSLRARAAAAVTPGSRPAPNNINALCSLSGRASYGPAYLPPTSSFRAEDRSQVAAIANFRVEDRQFVGRSPRSGSDRTPVRAQSRLAPMKGQLTPSVASAIGAMSSRSHRACLRFRFAIFLASPFRSLARVWSRSLPLYVFSGCSSMPPDIS